MKINLIILLFSLSLSQAYSQITGRVFIESSQWLDGIGTLNFIEFGNDSIYRKYQWSARQIPVLIEFGSYQVTHDTLYCQPSSSDGNFELIVSKSSEKSVLLKNQKVYNMDGSLSDIRIHGPVLEEFGKEQYRLWKKTIHKRCF